ncbi:ribonuclease HIII [Kiritimatiellaeota bacterium B1221]|nr:ribonuclease HIII [Kiritimatiellaeota bacterium B1221]
MNTFTQSLSTSEQQRLLTHLQQPGYEPREVNHAIAAAKKPGLNIVLYKSGKLVVQGKGLSEWIEFSLEPEILQRTLNTSSEPSTSPSPPASAHIGIDESGKGDFFGPMVVAAYHVPPAHYKGLLKLGVRDSKSISSDKKITSIASRLLEKTPAHCEVLVFEPEKYNPLVKKFGSVNRLLAWAHATVLENLLTRFPDTPRAVADQFGPEHQIISALKERGKKIELVQRHKAESDPAVAAASILARHRFVMEMKALGERHNCELPRGATHVRKPAEALVKNAGPEILARVAKTHFRTTRQVLEACGYDPALLGTPEPKDHSHWKRKK